VEQAETDALAARTAREHADTQAKQARDRLATAEHSAQETRREAERVGADLAAANQFLRAHVRVGGGTALSEELRVQDGYELALASALGGRLDAALVKDVAGAEELLNRAGLDGGTALLADLDAGESTDTNVDASAQAAPTTDAVRLLELLSGPAVVLELAARLLADAWVVERLEDLPKDFTGIATTRQGRVLFAAWGEVRQLSEGGTERVLARRNERDRLVTLAERAAQDEHAARGTCEQALEQVRAAEATRVSAEDTLREAERHRAEVGEARRRTEWLIEQRRAAPAQGALAVRKAELEGELAAERRQGERRERERVERLARIERLRAQHATDTQTTPAAQRLAGALAGAIEVVQARVSKLEAELASDREAGEKMAGALRACAAEEAEIQAALRVSGETVTAAEVAAQRLRDQAEEA